MMKRVVLVGSLVVLLAALGGGCQGPDEVFRFSSPETGTGGDSPGTGGTTATGGSSPGTGGRVTGAGGVLATGGTTGAAGQHGTGGTPGTGGTTGGAGHVGTGGTTATGGTTGTGGVAATGGVTGGGGRAGSGGVPATGGAGGRAGAGGPGGAAGAANCVDSIRQMGYAYPGAPACSMCKDNTTDLSTKCMTMIDCIEKSYPCTGNCQTNCLNMSGGSGVLSTCVNTLVTAACR